MIFLPSYPTTRNHTPVGKLHLIEGPQFRTLYRLSYRGRPYFLLMYISIFCTVGLN